MNHDTKECFLFLYARWLPDSFSQGTEICDQGRADLYFDGINEEEAERIR